MNAVDPDQPSGATTATSTVCFASCTEAPDCAVGNAGGSAAWSRRDAPTPAGLTSAEGPTMSFPSEPTADRLAVGPDGGPITGVGVRASADPVGTSAAQAMAA